MPHYRLFWDSDTCTVADHDPPETVNSAKACVAVRRQAAGIDDCHSSSDETEALDYSDDEDDDDTADNAEYDENMKGAIETTHDVAVATDSAVAPLLVSNSPTRFSIDGNSTGFSLAPYYGNSYSQRNTFSEEKSLIQQYPPLSAFVNGDVAPTASLRRLALVASFCRAQDDTCDDEDDMDKLAQLLKASTIVDRTPPSMSIPCHGDQTKPYPMQPRPINLNLNATRKRLRDEQEGAAAALRSLLRDYSESASKIIAAEEQAHSTRQKAAEEQKVIEREAVESEIARAEEKRLQREKQKAKESAEAAARKEAIRIREAAATEHITKANKLRAQLVEVQKSVAAFDASKAVAKRRLNMKKIVNGRVNTLAENADKIRSVAAEVLEAIAVARKDDAMAKEQQSASPELALGKRYLLNLLASNVIVRVQAEGFNGYVHVLKSGNSRVPTFCSSASVCCAIWFIHTN
jgi:hypothetical protein